VHIYKHTRVFKDTNSTRYDTNNIIIKQEDSLQSLSIPAQHL